MGGSKAASSCACPPSLLRSKVTAAPGSLGGADGRTPWRRLGVPGGRAAPSGLRLVCLCL